MTSEGVAVGTQHLLGFQPHFRGVSAITATRQDLEWPSCLLGQENRPQLFYQEGALDSHWAPGSRTRNPLLGRRGPRTGSKAAPSCWKPAGLRPGASPWTQRPKDEAPPGPTAASWGTGRLDGWVFAQKVVLGVAEAGWTNVSLPPTLPSAREGLPNKERETHARKQRSCALFPHQSGVTPEMLQGLHANSSPEGARGRTGAPRLRDRGGCLRANPGSAGQLST